MELTECLYAFPWSSSRVNNCNTYLIRTAEKAVLIDPGHSSCFDHVHRELDHLGLETGDVDLVICTHAHPDHMEAVSIFEGSPALFAMHRDDWDMVLAMAPLIRQSTGVDPESLAPDFFLAEGHLRVGDLLLEVFHTPGHSPGSVSLRWPAGKALFTGDLIFKGGIGRTDLPGGSGPRLKESIERLADLENEWLLPGHGELISGADAVRANFDQVERAWFRYL